MHKLSGIAHSVECMRLGEMSGMDCYELSLLASFGIDEIWYIWFL